MAELFSLIQSLLKLYPVYVRVFSGHKKAALGDYVNETRVAHEEQPIIINQHIIRKHQMMVIS